MTKQVNPKRRYTYYYDGLEFQSSPELARYLREAQGIEVWPTQINLMFSGKPPVALRSLAKKITRELYPHVKCDVCGKYIYNGGSVVTDKDRTWCCCSVKCLATKLMQYSSYTCDDNTVRDVLGREWEDS